MYRAAGEVEDAGDALLDRCQFPYPRYVECMIVCTLLSSESWSQAIVSICLFVVWMMGEIFLLLRAIDLRW